MTRILIARHGNTFESHETPVRVGVRTDLPLSSSGKLQAKILGQYLKLQNIDVSAVYCSNLIRTKQTARIAMEIAGLEIPITALSIFDELDYGPDEGKTEAEVIARIGHQALNAWDQDGIAPNDWLVDPQAIIENWLGFAANIERNSPQQTILVITSNGIARFAPYLTGNFAEFVAQYDLKIGTGRLCSITKYQDGWQVDFWNKKVEE